MLGSFRFLSGLNKVSTTSLIETVIYSQSELQCGVPRVSQYHPHHDWQLLPSWQQSDCTDLDSRSTSRKAIDLRFCVVSFSGLKILNITTSSLCFLRSNLRLGMMWFSCLNVLARGLSLLCSYLGFGVVRLSGLKILNIMTGSLCFLRSYLRLGMMWFSSLDVTTSSFCLLRGLLPVSIILLGLL